MQIFKKDESVNESNSVQSCSCNSGQDLSLSMRQVSWLVSGILLAFFFVFMAGYFWGQKKILEQFSGKLEQDSFSDKIYSSLYAMYDQDTDMDEQTAELTEESSTGLKVVEASANDQAPLVQKNESSEKGGPVSNKQQYYAQLAGFGSAQPAYAFAEKLNKTSKIALVKKHESKTAKGRVRYWYQVVTKPYDTKDLLASVVKKIKQDEHLKDIRILPC